MRKISGVDVLLKIKKGGIATPIGGQKGASLSRSAEAIDVSDKTSGGWTESIVGLKSWAIDCEGFITLGDTGFAEVVTAFDNRSPLEVEIKVGGEDGYTYTGSAIITDFPEEYQQDDAVTYSLSLTGVSALNRTENSVVSK